MDFQTSHLRPDGTTWPPVTPDPPAPPGYVDPIPQLEAALRRGSVTEPDAGAGPPSRGGTDSG